MEGDYLEKVIYVLREIAKSKSEDMMISILDNSAIEYSVNYSTPFYPNERSYNLVFNLVADVFSSMYEFKSMYEKDILIRLRRSSELNINEVKILPDYSRLEIVNLSIEPILTEWEEINQLQKKLVKNLEESNESIDYQNIGNSSRILMEKLSNKVFNPKTHKTELGLDLSKGKYKNRFLVFINNELKNNDNDLKKMVQSSVDMVLNSIDLMNTTTHKLNVKRKYAEFCVVSTITSISLIKIILENSKDDIQ